jgi:FkbM family methyltransferase
MPATQRERRRVYARANLPWRRLMGNRVVRRRVQGVDLYMPWSHLLPDYARGRPRYGQNLVALAEALHDLPGASQAPLKVMDIGANIGDSAAQIIARTDAQVLCVEGDPYWVKFLHMNLDENPRATIEEALLTPDEGDWATSSPVRWHGTTRFTQDADKQGALPSIPARALREKYPDFENLRLIKSDTDGFDPTLVPAAAEAWKDSPPVLFFEFDPVLARAADHRDPNLLWTRLDSLGYSNLAIWDNTGDPLGQLALKDVDEPASKLDPRPEHLGYNFWDVAACHHADSGALAVFDKLVPEPFSELGTWR